MIVVWEGRIVRYISPSDVLRDVSLLTDVMPGRVLAGIRRCFDVDIRLKQHRDVDNKISTLFQRCYQDVASTL